MTRYLSVLFLISWLSSCSSEPSFTVEFCKSLTEDDLCPADRSTFNIGDSVFVRLSSDAPFDAKEITGRIMRVTDNGEKYELGIRKFDLDPGTVYLTQNLPFHEFGYEALGTFSIEFSDEKGQLLAKREMSIAE